jgi:hypothetical protein
LREVNRLLKEFDLKPILCPICAAALKPPFEKCDYCGTYFMVSPPKKELKPGVFSTWAEKETLIDPITKKPRVLTAEEMMMRRAAGAFDLKPPTSFVIEKPPPPKPVRKEVPKFIPRTSSVLPYSEPSMGFTMGRIARQVPEIFSHYPSLIRRLAHVVHPIKSGYQEIQYTRFKGTSQGFHLNMELIGEKHISRIAQIQHSIKMMRDDFQRDFVHNNRPPIALKRMVQMVSAKEDEVGFKELQDNGTRIEGTYGDVNTHFLKQGLYKQPLKQGLYKQPIDVVMDTKTFHEYRNYVVPYRNDSYANVLCGVFGGEILPLRTEENIVFFLPRSESYRSDWAIHTSAIDITVFKKTLWETVFGIREKFVVVVLRPGNILYMKNPKNTSDLLGLMEK